MPKYVPKDIEWFIAEMIQEFTFSNGDSPLVWVNSILVHAISLDEGYERAMKLGAQYDDVYMNSDGVQVTTRFKGLRDLFLVHDKLEDGAELVYEELEDLSEDAINKLAKARIELAVFREAEVERPSSEKVSQ